MRHLSDLVDLDTLTSISERESLSGVHAGEPVFDRGVKTGFFVHLLAMGLDHATEVLNNRMFYASLSGRYYFKNGKEYPFENEDRTRWSTADFLMWETWHRDVEAGLPFMRDGSETLKRLSVRLPEVVLKKGAIMTLGEGRKKYPRKHYYISSRTLAYFLEFGVVRRLTTIRSSDPENHLCYNPYRQLVQSTLRVHSQGKMCLEGTDELRSVGDTDKSYLAEDE